MLCGRNYNMFIVDFDDTLFDTQAFKKARVEAAKTLGISKEVFWKAYKNARNDEVGNFVYTSERHAEILGSVGFVKEQILQVFKEVDAHAGRYIFPETIEFLKKIKAFGQPMILLSLGQPEFQYIKVKACGIEKYFDRIFMVDLEKEKVIEELQEKIYDGKIFLINDKPEETLRLKNKFPNINFILKQTDNFTEEEYRHTNLVYFKNLLNIYEHIRNNR